MIPSTFVVLDALPQTSSGKVDRNALPPIEGAITARTGAVVPPRDDVERELVRIWEDLLNVRPRGRDRRLLRPGGPLAPRGPLDGPDRGAIRPQALALDPLPGSDDRGSRRHLARRKSRTGARPWSPLVPIRPAGTGRPFFCVHPIGGNVLCYHELARHLGPDRPFFGLQAAGLEGEQPAETRLDVDGRPLRRGHPRRSSPRARTTWEDGRWGASSPSRWPGNSKPRASPSPRSS